MAINFTDSPANGATQVVAGRTYTYNSTKNKWDTSATEVTTTVYSTIDDLPLSGVSAGAQAYVSGNNRLYIWNGTGWYNIALINTAPSISGVSSSYALAIDGTATTVTITATDPEGIPITYSIASDTSGNTATVAQSGNVFTVTPSTNTAHAGTFSLTFRASDGVNIATAVSEFTLTFAVENSKYTTALITTSGSAGTNSTFTDSSSNSHTITANGNVAQTSFSPYRSGGYSTYFDGSGDYLTAAADTSFDFGSGDFTVEFWTYPTTIPSGEGGLVTLYEYASNRRSWYVAFDGSKLELRLSTSGTSADTVINSATGVFNANNWYHVAMVREGNNITGYVNGVSVATGTHSGAVYSNSTDPVIVGAVGTALGGAEYEGAITDIRIVKGTAVYTANFTPPTGRLTAITNTSLLACHLPYFADGSTNNHTLTPNGDVSTTPFTPYDHQDEYAVGDHGGSAYFDSNSSYLSTPDSGDWYLDGDFTIEFWFYKQNSGTFQVPFSQRQGSTSELRLVLDWSSGNVFTPGNIMLEWHAVQILVSGAGVRNETWNHLVVQRSGTSVYMYLNGYMVHGAQQPSALSNYSAPLTIGSYDTNAYDIKGNITDFRWVKGTAVYSTSGTVGNKLFTPPTEPLTAITNTKLLLNTQGAKIFDKSQSAGRMIFVGNTTASTAQYKYLPTSIYFDGTDDGIRIPMASGVGGNAIPPGSFVANEDFTIEMWHYLTARTELYPCLFSNYTTSGASTLGLFAGHNSSTTTQYQVAVNGTFPAINAGTINYNQWVHVALVRSSGTVTLYIDGTSVGTHSSNAALPGNGNWMGIGLSQDTPNDTNIQGYLSDVRITKGLARYTANFTPPSAALQG